MTIQVESIRWAAAQEALRYEVARVTALLRSLPAPNHPAPKGPGPNGPGPNSLAVGEWNLAEVAMHLSQVWIAVPGLARGDLSRAYEVVPSLAGTAGDSLIRDLWDLGGVTKLGVRSDPERDLAALADRIDDRAAEFFAESAGKSAQERRAWLVEGTTVPRSTLTCHLLNETVMHGYDVAHAAGREWPIERAHAAIVFSGFLVEVIRALGPRALVDQGNAAGLRATYDVRLRGGDSFHFVFDDGELHVEEPSSRRAAGRKVDCHISADPATMLMVAWGRRSQWPAIARGQLTAWGRKPWLGPRFRALMRNP